VLGVDEGGGAAAALRLADHRQGEGRLAGRFRPVDLDHAAAREAADADRVVDRDRAGRDGLDAQVLALAEAHDRPLAELTAFATT
jgi:hypothetical protein